MEKVYQINVDKIESLEDVKLIIKAMHFGFPGYYFGKILPKRLKEKNAKKK